MLTQQLIFKLITLQKSRKQRIIIIIIIIIISIIITIIIIISRPPFVVGYCLSWPNSQA